MQTLIRVLTSLFLCDAIAIAIGLLKTYISRSNRKEMLKSESNEHIIIRHPQIYIWIACVCIALFGALLIWIYFFPNDTVTVWVFAGFGVFVLMGNYLILVTLIFKIDIYKSKDYFLYRNILFRTYKIRYCDCVSYERKYNDFVVKTTGKTLRLDCDSTNIDYLISMLKQYEVKELAKRR